LEISENGVTETQLYESIALAVGETCFWWASIEDVIMGISLHLSWWVDDAFERDGPWDTLHIALANMDLRAKIATAKALAHKINEPKSPDFYERSEALLNFVDSTLRTERNRYVHDTWRVDGPRVVRSKIGPIVKRTQSRQRQLFMETGTYFAGPEEIQRFVDVLRQAYWDLAELDHHIAWLVGQKVQPSEHRQPLPLDWPSLAHREWLTTNRPPPQP
jgi:hypothetical protein